MLLWNDYEGQTLANAFPLEKLLRPEGRSAFFTTHAPDGTPDIIRLTESANDQDELLARWRQVSDAAQPNLITIKRFGHTTFQGVPLTYALMESTDAALTEILADRPLTHLETLEVAAAITAALQALHALQLSHGHIEPANVFACADTIKLRSDCVRDNVPDPDFNPEADCLARRQQDIHALGILLLQCLTLEKILTPATRLSAPFHRIIPNAIDGSWTLDEIAAALNPPTPLPATLAADRPLVPTSVLQQAIQAHASHSEPLLLPHRQLPLDYEVAETRTPPSLPAWATNPRLWLVAAAFLLVLVLIGNLLGRSTRQASTTASIVTPPLSAATPAVVVSPSHPANPNATTPSGWHVIAYTYKHEPQASARVAELQRRHPGLHAQVFAPGPHGPWLAALGGVMSRPQAEATLKQARRDGLPRDTFLRNFPAR